jgi:quercetin dioxygenase-like cupin family protein
MHRTALIVVPVLAVAGVLGAGTLAGATPGRDVAGPVLARGIFPDGLDAKFKVRQEHGVQVSAIKGPAQAVVQEITLLAGGHTGWHSHHGPAVVVVVEGALTVYDGDDASCSGESYGAGEAFVDPGQGHVHLARNETAGTTRLYVTYLVPGTDPETRPRIDEDKPGNCDF